MIHWFIYFECVILPLLVVVHVVALCLLYHRRNKKGCKHQMYIVTSLCICELNGILMVIVYDIALHKNVSSTVIGICFCYLILFVRLTHYATMTVLTIDRFLVFHLNMRYFILWPPKRLLKSSRIYKGFVANLIREVIPFKINIKLFKTLFWLLVIYCLLNLKS